RRPTMRSPASKASLRTGSWLRRRKSSRPVPDVPIAVEEVDGINNILHYLLLAARRSSPVRAAALSPVQSESPAPATARRGGYLIQTIAGAGALPIRWTTSALSTCETSPLVSRAISLRGINQRLLRRIALTLPWRRIWYATLRVTPRTVASSSGDAIADAAVRARIFSLRLGSCPTSLRPGRRLSSLRPFRCLFIAVLLFLQICVKPAYTPD